MKSDLRIGGRRRAAPLRFFFDGEPVDAYEGETVAVALWAAGVRRDLFCGMGTCQACALTIDGRRREACIALVRSGALVTSGTT